MLARIVTVLAAIAGLATVARFLYPRLSNWGATSMERDATYPGDDAVQEVGYRVTRAITIDADPEHIWPWLLQLGDGRGGLYSYDFLDRLFGFTHEQSATKILPAFQHLKPGDVIPVGRGGNFPVREVIENRALVLAGEVPNGAWLWSFILVPRENGTTRLLSRNLATLPPGIIGRVGVLILDVTAIIMTRRMLLNLKQRAESPAASGLPAGSHAEAATG